MKKHSNKMLMAAVLTAAAYGVMTSVVSAGIVEDIANAEVTSYAATGDLAPLTAGTTSLGALAGDNRTFTIDGNGRGIDGNYGSTPTKGGGVTVGSGQTLNLNNVNTSNFSTFATTTMADADNKGTINVSGGASSSAANVYDNNLDFMNDGNLNFTGGYVTLNGGISNSLSTAVNEAKNGSTTIQDGAHVTLGSNAVLAQNNLTIGSGGEFTASTDQLNGIGQLAGSSVHNISNQGTLNISAGSNTLTTRINDTGNSTGTIRLLGDITSSSTVRAANLDLNGNTYTLGSSGAKLFLLGAENGSIVANKTGDMQLTSPGSSTIDITDVTIDGLAYITLDGRIKADASKIMNIGNNIRLYGGTKLTLVGDTNTSSFVDFAGNGDVTIADSMTNSGTFANHSLTINAKDSENNTISFTTDADKLQTETTITNGGRLVLTSNVQDADNSGLLSQSISGDGKTVIDGNIVLDSSGNYVIGQNIEITAGGNSLDAYVNKFTGNVSVGGQVGNAGDYSSIILHGTSTDTPYVFNQRITGDGYAEISNDLNLSLGSNGSISNVLNNGILTAALTQVGSVENNGTFNTHGTMNGRNIGGTDGTTVLDGQLDVTANSAIEGTLAMNDQTINMQEADLLNNVYTDLTTPAAAYSTLTVGTLSGTGDLKIDLSAVKDGGGNYNNDSIVATNIAENTTVNLTSVNVSEAGYGTDNHLVAGDTQSYTIVSGAGSDTNLTFNVGANNAGLGTITSDNHRYTFTAGDTAGTLNVNVGDTVATLADFIQGNINEYNQDTGVTYNTYSLVGDYTTTVDLGTTGNTYNPEVKELNLYLNNHTLNGSTINNADPDNPVVDGPYAGVTVANGYTLNVNGGSTQGTVSGFTTALTNAGKAVVTNVTFTGNTTDIVNNANYVVNDSNVVTSGLIFEGSNNVNSISGNGGTLINGNLNITGTSDDALTQDYVEIASNGSLTANANVFGTNNINNKGNLYLGSGTLDSEVWGSGNVTVTGAVTNATTMAGNTLTINGAVYDSENPETIVTDAASLISNVDALSFRNISNNGTLNLGAGKLNTVNGDGDDIGTTISGNGTTHITGDVVAYYNDANGDPVASAINQNVVIDGTNSLTIYAGSVGAVDNQAGTLKLAGAEEDNARANLTEGVTGAGTTEIISGNVANHATLANKVVVDNGALLSSNISDLTSEEDITNDGDLVLYGDEDEDEEFVETTLNNNITYNTDKGTTTFIGIVKNVDKTINNNVVNEYMFTNAQGGTITGSVDNDGVFVNRGTISHEAGEETIVDNNGSFTNIGIIEAATVNNAYEMSNYGAITAAVNNAGTFDNGAVRYEADEMLAAEGAVITGDFTNIGRNSRLNNLGTVNGKVINEGGFVTNGLERDYDEDDNLVWQSADTEDAGVITGGLDNIDLVGQVPVEYDEIPDGENPADYVYDDEEEVYYHIVDNSDPENPVFETEPGVISQAGTVVNAGLIQGVVNNDGYLYNGSVPEDTLGTAPVVYDGLTGEIQGDVNNTGFAVNNGTITGNVTTSGKDGVFLNGVVSEDENIVGDESAVINGNVSVIGSDNTDSDSSSPMDAMMVNGGTINGDTLTVSNGADFTNGVLPNSNQSLGSGTVNMNNINVDGGTITNSETINATEINVDGHTVMEPAYEDVPVAYTADQMNQMTAVDPQTGESEYDASDFEDQGNGIYYLITGLDDDNNPIYDSTTEPVMVQATDENGNPLTEYVPDEYTVESGVTNDPYASDNNYELIATNDDGSKVYYKKDSTGEHPYEGDEQPVMVQATTPALDEDGDPIIAGGTLYNIPTVEDVDEEGNPILSDATITTDKLNVGEDGTVANAGTIIANTIDNDGGIANITIYPESEAVIIGDIDNDGIVDNENGTIIGDIANGGVVENNGGTIDGNITNEAPHQVYDENGNPVTEDVPYAYTADEVAQMIEDSQQPGATAQLTEGDFEPQGDGTYYLVTGEDENGDPTYESAPQPVTEPSVVELKDGTVTGDVTGGEGVLSSEGNDEVGGDVNVDTLSMDGGNLHVGGTLTTNELYSDGGALNLQNGETTTSPVGEVLLDETMDLMVDADILNKGVDALNGSYNDESNPNATINIAGINVIADNKYQGRTRLDMFNGDEESRAALKDHLSAGDLRNFLVEPIFMYSGSYDSNDGYLNIDKRFNPAVLVGPVAAQMGGYLTQLNSYDEAFRNMDMYMLMTSKQRQALKFRNKMASLEGGVYDNTVTPIERPSGWLRPYATFEKVGLHRGPKVENTAWGSFFGGESEMKDLGHGWDGMWGAYVGYNGSHQSYESVGIYQNGGTLGLVGMAYKDNFFIGGTINTGANAGEASTMYGHEDFAMLMAGIAAKTGYNWELADGKFIIQPNLIASYTFVNTFDYTNAAGVKIDSDPLHAIQIEPGVKFIGNLKNGWQPYAGVSVVINIMDRTHFMANDVTLPSMSVNPFVKYGVGVRKTWGERLTGYFQTFLMNGGRTGVGLQAGFRFAFGKDGSNNVGKGTTPELKKTEVKLSSMK